jgi:hypothetical protein
MAHLLGLPFGSSSIRFLAKRPSPENPCPTPSGSNTRVSRRFIYWHPFYIVQKGEREFDWRSRTPRDAQDNRSVVTLTRLDANSYALIDF